MASKLQDLINRLCPNGVEYRRLGDCVRIRNGSDYKHLQSGDIPVFGSGGLMTYVDRALYDKVSVLIPRKGSIDKLYYVDKPFWTVDTLFYTEIDLTVLVPKYLFYALQKEHLEQYNTAGGVPSLTQGVLNKVVIPVPPLEVQGEIVQILDNFAELTAELTAELEKRKKQYEHCRDSLMTFGPDVQVKAIGEITRVFSAARVHKDEWKTEGVPFYRSSDVMSWHRGEENSRGKVYISYELYEKLAAKSGKFHKGDVFVTGGGSIGMPYIVPSDDPLYVKDADLICIQKNDRVDSQFLYYYFMSTRFRDYLSSVSHGSTIAHYTISQVEKTPIPLPPLAEQRRIVSILDRFDRLCNDLTAGLPAEIAARKKQYAYYRDKLLAFKRAS